MAPQLLQSERKSSGTQRANPDASLSEAPFLIEELFFSRTDARGIILAANSVFQRISQFSWDDLLKAPHRLIRHPDIPRGVFHLMWAQIKAGKPIGAYVKNRAKDGRFYWVFAVVTPIDGGYLSVRLKPTSPLLDVVISEYAVLRRRETQERLSPEDSANALAAMLCERGFADYAEFMAVALASETQARETTLAREPIRTRTALQDIVALAQNSRREVAAMLAIFGDVEIVASNFRLQSSRHGGTHGPLSTIANNYNVLTSEIRAAIAAFSANLAAISAAISNTLFLTDTAAIQTEVADLFEVEKADLKQIDAEDESRRLDGQRRAYQLAAARGFCDVFFTAKRLSEGTGHMHRLVSGLDVARIMCEIETAQLHGADGSMTDIIADLTRFQKLLARALNNLDKLNEALIADFKSLATLEVTLDPNGPAQSVSDFRGQDAGRIAIR